MCDFLSGLTKYVESEPCRKAIEASQKSQKPKKPLERTKFRQKPQNCPQFLKNE
jgi:hypothetical protein